MMTMRELGRLLKAKRQQLGIEQADVARIVGANQSTVSKWERGTQEPHHRFFPALAEFLGIPRSEFIVMEPPQEPAVGYWLTTRLVGAVQAGEWIEAVEWPVDEQERFVFPCSRDVAKFKAQAFEVRGDSMDLVYPEGTIVIAVSTIATGLRPQYGDRVIVTRRNDHGEYEVTIKEYRIITDNPKRPRALLFPRSSNPQWQDPLPADDPHMETTVTGIVVAAAVYEPVLSRALKTRRP
jgi:transcriptional regulator with XRE-family HTH domain